VSFRFIAVNLSRQPFVIRNECQLDMPNRVQRDESLRVVVIGELTFCKVKSTHVVKRLQPN
jgi:hypothetical protein